MLVRKRNSLLILHRYAALLFSPFILLSLIIAVGLTHPRLLDKLSQQLYPSLTIPSVSLNEPLQQGSWDQALKVAELATGKIGHVITTESEHVINIQAFEEYSHDPAVAKVNPHLQLLINTDTMQIVRVQDKHTSLLSKAHGIHGFRLGGVSWLSLSVLTVSGLSILLLSGIGLAWHYSREHYVYTTPAQWHVRIGLGIAGIIVIVVVTTLDLEFALFGRADKTATHAIPPVQLTEALRVGSIDQARHLAALATGVLPKAAFIRGAGSDIKFSEVGDGIGGKSVWIDANTMTIHRISDWRNDKQAFVFMLHDGRFLGGMNALNLYDVVSLLLLFLMLNGWVIYRRSR
jgi:hypothetical protein